MNNSAVVKVIIFATLLMMAMYLGDVFLSAVLRKPINEVPAVAKFIAHGVTLGLIFLVLKKYFGK